jgi:hypothetical protein
VSHSSLSVDERRRAEAAFSEARNCVIVATSTLELGIDVGDLAQVCHLQDKCQSDQSVKFQYGTTFVVPYKKLSNCNEKTLCSTVTNLGWVESSR